MILPVVLSGGVGSRLWPLSSKEMPKQFLKLFSENSLLQETILRVNPIENILNPLIVCNQNHRNIVKKQLQEIHVDYSTIILEPIGRNTAPAIAIAALQAIKQYDDPVLLVLPADHLMKNVDAFVEAIHVAQTFAEQNYLTTFGVVPTMPATGYGYIRADESIGEGGHLVGQFVEKPDLERAQRYLQSSNYFWNSGMFMFRASVILRALEQYALAILQACQKTFNHSHVKENCIWLGEQDFKQSPKNSIDYAVMEHADKAVVVPLDAGWSDIGSWSAVLEKSCQDVQGNVTIGDVLAQDVKGSYLRAESRRLAVMGVEDIVVIETPGEVLVMHRSQAEQVKEISEGLSCDE